MSLDTHDDDLATRFAATRRMAAPTATEADLDAVHARARHVQRRRVLGGSAAAGLLVVGGGALALTGGSSSTTSVAPAAEGAPLVVRDTVEPDAPTDGSTPPSDDVEVPGQPADDPAPATPELPDLTDVPLPALPPLPEAGPDGTTDWDAYVDDLGRSLETWLGELTTWIEANPEVTTFLDLVGPFDEVAGPLGGVEIDEWLTKLQDLGGLLPDGATDLAEWEAKLEELGIDVDAWKVTVEEWSSQYDQNDLDDWSARADEWSNELGELDLGLDRWLDELDFSNLDALGEFDLDELLEGLDLSQLDALGDVDLGGLFEGLDLSEIDLDLDAVLADVDLSELGLDELFADLDLGGLFGGD